MHSQGIKTSTTKKESEMKNERLIIMSNESSLDRKHSDGTEYSI